MVTGYILATISIGITGFVVGMLLGRWFGEKIKEQKMGRSFAWIKDEKIRDL